MATNGNTVYLFHDTISRQVPHGDKCPSIRVRDHSRDWFGAKHKVMVLSNWHMLRHSTPLDIEE